MDSIPLVWPAGRFAVSYHYMLINFYNQKSPEELEVLESPCYFQVICFPGIMIQSHFSIFVSLNKNDHENYNENSLSFSPFCFLMFYVGLHVVPVFQDVTSYADKTAFV